MSGSSYAYASGRVSGLEETLLPKRIWSQLIAAEDREEVLRILGDSWYGTLLQTEDSFSEALRQAVSRAEEELSELSRDSAFTRGILQRRDARNARYLWKSFAAGENAEVEVEPSGMISIDYLRRAWADSSAADSLPLLFKQALEEIQQLHSPSAVEIDTILDRLAASIESDNLGQMDGPVATIPRVKIELRNFLAAARGRNEEQAPSAIEEMLLDGGYHSPSDIAEAVRVNRLSALLGETQGFEGSALALEEGFESGSFLSFQKESDRMTMDILERVSGDLFSPGPLAAYVLRRELEASHLKLIAAGKAAGIDSRRLSARIPRG